MKKRIVALFLALAMVLSFAACAKKEDTTAETTTEEETKVDLGDKIVLYSSMTEFDLEALTTCFNAVYPDIEIEVVSGSAGEFTNKIKAEADNPQGDVTWGGLSDSDGTKYADLFEEWVSANDAEAMDGYSTDNGLYSMDHLSTVCFCVNTELEKELGLNIQSYADLLDPKLKGKIVISDPNSSSAAWNNLCNIFSVYGVGTQESWDYISALMENLVIVEKSSLCFNSVYDGEYVVGLTYEDGAIKLNQNGSDHTEVRYPSEGTSAAAYGMAIVKGAPHMEAAKALVDFVTSADGQSAMAAYQEGTLRYTNKNYVCPDNAWLTDSKDITWVARPVAELTEQKSALLEKWNSLLQ